MNAVRMVRRFFPLLLCVLACACHQPPSGYKVGNSYSVDGVDYTPEYDEHYDKVGVASWYGPGFDGKRTASGETFNQDDLTAAHPTLPLPSIVRVTNLSNGKSVVVRVNDRGPFAAHRIIDLSKASAERIGLRSTGQVRVQYLRKETEEYLATLPGNQLERLAEAREGKNPDDEPEEVEASEAEPGEVVDAAPYASVSSSDLDATAHSEPAKPARTLRLIEPAMAEEAAPQPTVAEHPYIIQAGVFSTSERAKIMMKKFPPSSVEKISARGKTLWRVRVGPFDDREAAEKILKKVRAAGVADARIMQL